MQTLKCRKFYELIAVTAIRLQQQQRYLRSYCIRKAFIQSKDDMVWLMIDEALLTMVTKETVHTV